MSNLASFVLGGNHEKERKKERKKHKEREERKKERRERERKKNRFVSWLYVQLIDALLIKYRGDKTNERKQQQQQQQQRRKRRRKLCDCSLPPAHPTPTPFFLCVWGGGRGCFSS